MHRGWTFHRGELHSAFYMISRSLQKYLQLLKFVVKTPSMGIIFIYEMYATSGTVQKHLLPVRNGPRLASDMSGEFEMSDCTPLIPKLLLTLEQQEGTFFDEEMCVCNWPWNIDACPESENEARTAFGLDRPRPRCTKMAATP